MRIHSSFLKHLIGAVVSFAVAYVFVRGEMLLASYMTAAGTQAEIIVALLWMAVLFVPYVAAVDTGLALMQHGLLRFSFRALNVVFGVLFGAAKGILTIALMVMCVAFCGIVLTSLVMKAALPLALLYAAAAVVGYNGARIMNKRLKKHWEEE